MWGQVSVTENLIELKPSRKISNPSHKILELDNVWGRTQSHNIIEPRDNSLETLLPFCFYSKLSFFPHHHLHIKMHESTQLLYKEIVEIYKLY